MKRSAFFAMGWHWTLLSLCCLLLFLTPLLWMVSTALKPLSEIYAYPPIIFSSHPDWWIWTRVLSDPQILRFFLNSLVVSSGTTALTLMLAVPCAYGLARLPFRGRSFILLITLATLMFPSIMIATPLYIIFSRLGLLNTYAALILADSAISLPFAVVMLRPTFKSLPRELSEAAQIDGCGPWKIFLLVILPLVVPGILTVSVFTFLTGWGDLLMSLSFVSDESMRPVTAGLFKYIGNNIAQWNTVMAFATLQLLPPLLLFLVTQRYVVSGLTDAAVKQ